MRLITLLLLLITIHLGSCRDSNSQGSGDSHSKGSKKNSQFQQCLASRCIGNVVACNTKQKCMDNFRCLLRHCVSSLATCYINCVPDETAQKLLQCAADQKCIPHKTKSCPGESIKNQKKPDNPDFMQQLTGNIYQAILTSDPDKNGPFNDPCAKHVFLGDKENAGFALSNCYGNSTTGECVTGYTHFFGNGKQRGNREIIDLTLTEKEYLLNPSNVTVYFHRLVKNKYALVEFCFEDDVNLLFSKQMVLSPFDSIEAMFKNSKDPNATKTDFKQTLREYAPDNVDDVFFYPMDHQRCKN